MLLLILPLFFNHVFHSIVLLFEDSKISLYLHRWVVSVIIIVVIVNVVIFFCASLCFITVGYLRERRFRGGCCRWWRAGDSGVINVVVIYGIVNVVIFCCFIILSISKISLREQEFRRVG